MPAATATESLRNLALLGHAGAGKTTLAEALLLAAGVHGVGSDFTEQEKHHGHSLVTALLHADFDGCSINLLDTPGAPDFLGQAMSAFPAVETAAVVVNATRGIEPMTRRMMKRAGERKLCRMLVINKIDQAFNGGAVDLGDLLTNLRQTFGNGVLPVNLPAENGTKIVDCFSGIDGESDLGPVADWHQQIVDQVVEVDEALMETYLEQGEVRPDQLHAPFEQALREGHLIPVVFTAVPHEGDAAAVGIAEMLKFIVQLAPNPGEGNPRPFVRGSGDVDEQKWDLDPDHEIHAAPEADKHVLAHVFAVRVDPFRGKLACFRVHQGTVTKDTQLFVDDAHRGESKKPVKVGHLFRINGDQCVEVDRAIPGDLVAVAKIDDIHFDAVLHDHHDEDDVHLRPLRLPEPMAGVAITPKKRGDEQKLADALVKLQDEDPTLRVSRDNVTHETVLRGLGDLHLRVTLEKLAERHHVEVDTAPPKVAYRETILGSAEGQHRHKKQTGGAGQFGEVKLAVEALERGVGFEFVDDTFGGSIPKPLIPAIEKGVRVAMDGGVVAGYPLQDVRVRVLDGKYHPVDSKEIAFITAGKRAFLDAVSKAKPVLLEPMVEAEVVAPASHLGDLTADLSTRRGRITGTDFLPGDMAALHATVPLSELTTYNNQLRAMTGGTGSFSMELVGYEPAPRDVQQRVSAEFELKHDDD
ncbi:MAG: elongation factor G [Planctomycetota bacterium]